MRIVLFLLIALCAAGCIHFHSEPLSPQQTLVDFEARRLDAPGLRVFLQTTDGDATWPPRTWDLRTLTFTAFYYSPDLDVARAQWDVAQGGVISAGARPNPSVTAAVGYNSSTPAHTITPWIPEVMLDFPIEVAGKRGLRVAQARQRAEAARLNVLTTAWQIRGRVRQALLDLFASRQSDSLLVARRAIQAEMVRILDAQRTVGEVSPYEVTQARIALASTQLAAYEAARQQARARSELADALGVPPAALDSVTLSFQDFDRVATDLPTLEIRRRALVNRPDVLRALAEYEASQHALQLEIRKQYPDINLGPGFQLDQTDAKWTLGLNLVLPLLNRNRGPIAEAEARRKEAAARFLALQSQVLAELERSVSAARTAVAQVQAANGLFDDLARQEQSAAAAYRVGEISKLELLGIQAEMANTAQARLDARVAAQQAFGALEDAMQTPFDVTQWVVETPQRTPEIDENSDE